MPPAPPSDEDLRKQPFGCSVQAALSVIGGRWKPLILFKLMERETLRFSELRRLAPDATQKMLTSHLRELEEDGVVARRVYPEIPPRVEYRLTAYGRTLGPILIALRDWGVGHLRADAPRAVADREG